MKKFVIKEQDLEKCKELLVDAIQMLKHRKTFIAIRKLNNISEILLNVKEIKDDEGRIGNKEKPE